MIYFISDTHFNHENIIKYCNRPFKDVKEMDYEILTNWNKKVKKDDTIYHLGDLALGDKEEFFELSKNLNGKKYLIKGNHDNWSINSYKDMGFIVLTNPQIKLKKYKFLLSHVPLSDKYIPQEYINIHGHIHNKYLHDFIYESEIKNYSIKKHVNISCDVTNFMPISIEEINKLIKNKI